MPILGHFAATYGSMASELGVPADDLYQALVDTAENTVKIFIFQIVDIHAADGFYILQPPNWFKQFLQATVAEWSKAVDLSQVLPASTLLGRPARVRTASVAT